MLARPSGEAPEVREALPLRLTGDDAVHAQIEGGLIENVYRLQVMNMTEVPRTFRLEVSGLPGVRIGSGERVEVSPAATGALTVQVLAPYDAGQPGANAIVFRITAEDDPGLSLREETTFLIPR